MRNVDVHILRIHARQDGNFLRRRRQSVNGKLKDLTAVHIDVGTPAKFTVINPCRETEHIFIVGSVGIHPSGQNTGLCRGLQHHCPCAVAKKYARCAVLHVDNARHRFRPDDQRTLIGTCTEHGIGSIKRINKARAHGLYVERRAPRRADQTLHGRCRRRKYLIRRRRRHNDQINRLGINAAPFKRLLCGCGSQRGSRFRRSIDEASSFNAGTRTNPFIRSFNAVGSEPSGKVLIGDAGRRKRGPCGNDAGVFG